MIPSRNARRGSAYLMVLMSTALVVIIGLSGLLAMRVRARVAHAQADAAIARTYAASAVELALEYVYSDPDWRDTFGNGAWTTDMPFGKGLISIEAEDPDDGDVTSGPADPVVITGIAKVGKARQRISVTLEADQVPLECLDAALHVGGFLNFDGADVDGAGLASTNATAIANSANVYLNVEATGEVTGLRYHADASSGNPVKPLPGASAISYYKSIATPINYADIPGGEIKKVLLSPASNPYGGALNAQGVYLIDCGGNKIEVEDSRIVGTIIIVNPKSDSRVYKSVHWAPAVANFPSLLVQGSMSFETEAKPLDEDNLEVNFNPPGTPYEGSEDNDEEDVYPSVIEGLVFVTGSAEFKVNTAFDGVVLVAGQALLNNDLTFSHDSTFYDNPPPGFLGAANLAIAPGSWTAVID